MHINRVNLKGTNFPRMTYIIALVLSRISPQEIIE